MMSSDYLNFSLSIWTSPTVQLVMSALICSIRVKIPEIRYILCDKIYWRYRLKWNWLNGTRSSCFIFAAFYVGMASCVGGLQYSGKVGRVFPMVIWPEFRMGQYWDDDHREDAPQFNMVWKPVLENLQACIHPIEIEKVFAIHHFHSWLQNFQNPDTTRLELQILKKS